MRSRFIMVAAALTLLALPSFAEDKPAAPPAPPVRIRALVMKFDNNMLAVKTEKEEDATIAVTPKTDISGLEKRKLSDIKSNDFVGITAMTGKDGKMNATEVHIFPEAMRGRGEGHYPWDKGPESTMTNAAVGGMVSKADGQIFTLNYKNRDGTNGTSEIEITPNIPIVTFVKGDPSLLKPGAHIVAFAAKGADGSLTALAIIAEKDGVRPPM